MKSTVDEEGETTQVRVAVAGVGDSPEKRLAEIVSKMLSAHGHSITRCESIGSEQKSIQRFLREAIESAEIDAIVMIGGTGFNKGEVTLEAVLPFEEKTLPGFSELFRMLCFEEMGSSAIFMRAVSFISEGKVVFCIPGDENAARVAVEGLIAPQLPRSVAEATSSRAGI